MQKRSTSSLHPSQSSAESMPESRRPLKEGRKGGREIWRFALALSLIGLEVNQQVSLQQQTEFSSAQRAA